MLYEAISKSAEACDCNRLCDPPLDIPLTPRVESGCEKGDVAINCCVSVPPAMLIVLLKKLLGSDVPSILTTGATLSSPKKR